MIITDTHTHLYMEQFDKDRNEVMKRSIEAGVSRFFIPSINLKYIEKMLNLESEYPDFIFLMIGLHPAYVKKNVAKELALVKEWIDKRKFYAIGEIGIDLYWNTKYLKEQQYAFKTQIQWAKELKIPINIHCRNAFDEIFDILESEKGDDLYGIFHCFTGNIEQAKQAISYNMKLGIGGVVTFKNSKIDTFLNKIPISEIVLETDSPYLAPVPHRGKRNESSYLINILDKLSQIYEISTCEVARITTDNSKDVFRI